MRFKVVTRQKLTAAAGALVCAVVGVSAAMSSASAPADAAAASGGTLVVDTSFIVSSIDPARDLDPTGYIVDRALYDTLLTEYGANTKVEPDLATSYSASPNATTYTFNLRHGVKFSDGTPLTSADVVYSLTRVVNLNSDPAYLLAGITATADGPYTVVLKSKTPNPAIPEIVTTPALGIVNAKAVTAHGGSDAANASKTDKAGQFLDSTSEGTGPYVLTSFSTNNQILLTANPTYWGPKPQFSRVVMRDMEAPTQLLNVQRGTDEVALDLSSQEATTLDSDKNVQVHVSASPNLFSLQANASAKISPVTANPDIQKAIRLGMNYAGIVATAGPGAIQAAGLIPIQFLGGLPTSQAVKTNVAEAQKLVKASGIKNPSVTLTYPSDISVNGLSFETLAERQQADLGAIGIKVSIKAVPVATFLPAYSAGKYQLIESYWGPDYPDPNDYLVFLPRAALVLLAVGITFITFALTDLVPGNPALANLGQDPTQSQIHTFDQHNGVNEPFFEQFGLYLDHLVHGDLGTSQQTGDPVTSDLGRVIPATAELAILSILIALVFGIGFGLAGALWRDRPIDHVLRIFSLIGVSVPTFWLALVALYILFYQLGVVPGGTRLSPDLIPPHDVTGMYTVDALLEGNLTVFWNALEHLILPAVILATANLGLLTRYTRSAVLEVMDQDYIRAARAKGLPARSIVFRHILRAALPSIVTVIGLAFANVMTGAVLVEDIFSWPGLGQYGYLAAIHLDLPAIAGVSLFIAVVYVTVNFVVDILYGLLDPRIRVA